ncbi:MAG: hypothetical protein K2H85_06030, partial [Allobaculum sp.]|nr:hypothetical protein [Allobaculum sp.]
YMPCEYGNSMVSKHVTLSTWGLDDAAYGFSLQLWGIVGENTPYEDDATDEEKLASGAYPILVMFDYNENTDEGSLRIKLGQILGKIETPDGSKADVFLSLVTDEGGIQNSGTVTFTWNETGDELYLTSSPLGDDYVNFAGLYLYGGSYYIADYICYDVTKLTRDR